MNGWQRIGVILSVFWCVASGLYIRVWLVDQADEVYNAYAHWCPTPDMPEYTRNCFAHASARQLEERHKINGEWNEAVKARLRPAQG
jgi:hypothetical protein